MKLEYLHDLSGDGKYPGAWPAQLIRLYDFEADQSLALVSLIQQLLDTRQSLDLASVSFIEPVNCNLTLALSATDRGIVRTENSAVFNCYLTEAAYNEAIAVIQAVGDGYNWLDDASDSDIAFLYSPGGTW